MKKISLIALSGVLMIGGAYAGFQQGNNTQRGGFVGGPETIVTVSQVKEMRDDTPVIIQGNILQRMGNEKYLFQDSTGSITVEIDDDDWRGLTVTPNDTVKLMGEVDAGLFNTEIEIESIQIVPVVNAQ